MNSVIYVVKITQNHPFIYSIKAWLSTSPGDFHLGSHCYSPHFRVIFVVIFTQLGAYSDCNHKVAALLVPYISTSVHWLIAWYIDCSNCLIHWHLWLTGWLHDTLSLLIMPCIDPSDSMANTWPPLVVWYIDHSSQIANILTALIVPYMNTSDSLADCMIHWLL